MLKNKVVHDFISVALQSGGWMELDRLYLENQVLALIGPVEADQEEETNEELKTSKELMNDLLIVAAENKKFEMKDFSQKHEFEAKLMSFLTPPPSVVNALFSQHYDNTEKEATDYFYLMNLTNGFINEEMNQKISSDIEGNSFVLQSKKESVSTEPVQCPYCFDSEGYGMGKEVNKRIIRMNLRGDSWGFFFSPEPLLKEHGFFIPETHQPLVMNRQLQETMLQLVDVYPHYFISFNPKVVKLAPHGFLYGGDAHIPLAEADNNFMFDIPGFVTVEASLVEWPTSVIRLKTTSKKNLMNALEYVTLKWQQYSYPSLDIIAKDEDGKDLHSVVPVFRKEKEAYIVEMILQDSSKEFKQTKDYKKITHEDVWPVDCLGVINLNPTVDINENVMSIISENMEKQSIFRRPNDGQKAFLRFVDTL